MAFTDLAEPVSRLTDPAQRTEEILGQPFSNPGSMLDWLSPSHIINEVVKQAVGYDVFGEAANALSGNWEQVWKTAGTFRNLANAMQDIAANVLSGNVELDRAWHGNAADAAYMYFNGLNPAIAAQYEFFDRLAEEYEKAAEGTYRISEMVSGVLKDLIDAAMIAAVAASAGTAAIETGVGFVTGWGIAAYEAYRIAELADRARKLIAIASATVGAAAGAIQTLSAETNPVSRHPLPDAGYRHPGSKA